MTKPNVHTLAVFQKPNGFIVFATANCTDSSQISEELQTQYNGGKLLRTFIFDLPLEYTTFWIAWVVRLIQQAGYPPMKEQLLVIDNVFSDASIA